MDTLVSTGWLAANLDHPNLVVLDASAHLPNAGRDAAQEFAEAHIPGARYLDLPSLRDETSDFPAALPRADQFEERLRAIGIAPDDAIVLYDNSRLRSSARAYFIFGMFGLENVAILDGGFEKWIAEDRATEAGLPTVEPSNFEVRHCYNDRVRGKTDMLANCERRDEQVVDARDADRFTGSSSDTVHGLEGGHIPGSRHLFFRSLLTDNGAFKSREALKQLFDEAGLDLTKPLVASCGSGMTASVVLFAAELLGKHDTALYDGSWSEWGADPDTPKETGPAR